ncbi:MAG: hypothetical protein GWP91_15270 [Rhodobacterales bacterium]|nr:hypothetical protein [Rhodobacterales bacterium]
MSETIQSALDVASVDGGLFVALATTDSHKDLAVWMWRVERQKISRVNMPGLDRSVFEVLDTATRVVNLRWNETELQQPADGTLALLNRSNVDVVPSGLDTDALLIDELMEHPNKCLAQLSSESVAMMKERAAERPGTDLFVNVHVPFRGKGDHLWRWSEADETLHRVQGGR